MNSKLSKSVLSKIKKEEIKPLPKSYFIFRNILWWSTFVLSIFLGAAGFAVTLFAFVYQRFDFIDLLKAGKIGSFLPLLPFFWIFFFGVFIWASFWGITHTKKAYRIPRFLMISLNILLTLLLGTGIYMTRQAENFENIVGNKMLRMKTVREARINRWERGIEQGRLAGEIKQVKEDSLIVVSFQEKDWKIDITQTDIHSDVLLEVGVKIGMRGAKTGDSSFRADQIRLWDPSKVRRPSRGNQRGGERDPQKKRERSLKPRG